MDTTSAVGGYAAGVLGCTTDAGQITLINGWNFYAGSDATQIGSAQYDFETVVTHELGHALGIGHSTDSASVMYATLNTGSVNRSLTTADLNVADSNTTGACGLHAATIPIQGVEVSSNLPATSSPGPEAFFALLARPANAGTFAPAPLVRFQARDAVFANPTRDVGTANLAALRTAPIFAATAMVEMADDPLADFLQDGTEAPLLPSAHPTEAPDPRFDFIPSDSAFDTQC
jgi:hypothetical protein